ncbi:cytochrome c peroxidase [Catalinimonas alkaloidigena]|uniref:cytochrome-c peroxidase n=1 Tax=Catalinimonas alkaloidigena TaxID=1075417 RepID=UPI0024071262|nr:cytochrome c peroxidase [Catalinimonas alkaloidigena]MDF9798964.1 cytochrome c peroxidase [Catalinimonas alkaloidigena]
MYISRFTANVCRWVGSLILGVCLTLLFSCQTDEIEGMVDRKYIFVKPDNFPEPTYTFDNNPVTEKGFELGRKLFFDPVLSRDGSVSCNNCHIQATAFADGPQHPMSVGVDNRRGTRNAPALTNLAFMREFFWDGGVTHLDFVPTNAIENAQEMDESLANVVDKLNQDDEYPALFKEAFGIDTITSPYMLHAFSQFLVMMVSANSKYDKYMRNEGESLTDAELEGMKLFEEKCASCHEGILFSDFSFRNNGINASFGDEGRARITEHSADQGKFRVPSLRNVGRTAPYMHNARFQTLEEVLRHYAGGVVDSPTLDPLLSNGAQLGISMTEEEQTKIIAFLKTLSDYDFVADQRFTNPNH